MVSKQVRQVGERMQDRKEASQEVLSDWRWRIFWCRISVRWAGKRGVIPLDRRFVLMTDDATVKKRKVSCGSFILFLQGCDFAMDTAQGVKLTGAGDTGRQIVTSAVVADPLPVY
jgi:hypothetical protein